MIIITIIANDKTGRTEFHSNKTEDSRLSDGILLNIMSESLDALASRIAKSHNCDDPKCYLTDQAMKTVVKLEELREDIRLPKIKL